MLIRQEHSTDETVIGDVISAAFAQRSHTNHAEASIVRRLREDGDLPLSLVAEPEGRVVGHIAFSPITINALSCSLLGLGPLAVSPASQNQGIGSALVTEGLRQIRQDGASGCVVLGDAAFYSRFGFVRTGSLAYGALPLRFIQQLIFSGEWRAGKLGYASAFDLAQESNSGPRKQQ